MLWASAIHTISQNRILENFVPFGRGCVKLNTRGGVAGAKCLGGGREAHRNWPKAGLTEPTKGVLAVLSVGGWWAVESERPRSRRV